MIASRPALSRRLRAGAATTLLAAGAAVALTAVARPAAAAPLQSYLLPSAGTITVDGHGYGHGHGMSQYGARGAAKAGLTAAQIAKFYYPGTTLTTLAAGSGIRVLISDAPAYTTVRAASGMTLIGAAGTPLAGVSNPLPTSGITSYRLVPRGSTGLALQRLTTTWADVAGATALPARADFRGGAGEVRLLYGDGTSTVYRGTVGAVRSGSGEITVNRLGIDDYTAGVVAREMPSSWEPAAVAAQAIAARSYGVFEREHAGGQLYDICSTDQCQVYGGKAHYDSAGSLLWSEYQPAATATARQVLQYGGATIFSQFSASSGGWTADGGQPYLTAHPDGYDNAASGDPYLNWERTPSVSRIASYYGLAKVSRIDILQRDGNGQWGGRVLSANVVGVAADGSAQTVGTTGFGLQSAMGLPHHWFAIAGSLPGAPTSVTATPGDAGGTVSWQPPTYSGGSAITGYSVTFGTYTIFRPATARSAYVGPRANFRGTAVVVRAMNSSGSGPYAATSFTPMPAPFGIQPLAGARLFDSRSGGTRISAAAPLVFAVPGHGGIPTAGARAVQFALTVVNPTASGTLSVFTSTVQPSKVAAVAYHAGRTTTVTLMLPLRPSTQLRFVPSAGALDLVADQLGYTTAAGQRIASVPPASVADLASVPTTGTTVPLGSVPGVSATTTAVVLAVQGRTIGKSGWLRLWPNGATAPAVSQVTVGTGGSDGGLVIVPLGTARSIRIASSTANLGAKITLVGVIGSTGGLLEVLPMTPTADPAGGTSAVAAGSTPGQLVLLGTPQLPTSGVGAVLLHVTVTAATAGTVTLWAAGTSPALAPSVRFRADGPVTATVLVPVGAGGAIQLVTSGPSASVVLDTIGYVTAS